MVPAPASGNVSGSIYMVSINSIIGGSLELTDVYVTNYTTKSKCKVGTINNNDSNDTKFGSISIVLSREGTDKQPPILLSHGDYFGIYVLDTSAESSSAPRLSIEGSVYYSLTYNQSS